MLPNHTPLSDWHMLPDEAQLFIAREALCRAAETIAGRAELLAGEIEAGEIADRGGPDALRLLAAVVRMSGRDMAVPAGAQIRVN